MELLSRALQSRLNLILIVLGLILIGITAHLFNLQIMLTSNFFQLGRKNFVRYEKVQSPRGNIVDSLGNLLATNRPITKLYWQGTGLKNLSDDQIKVIAQLHQLLPLAADIYEQIRLVEKQGQQLMLAQEVPFELLSKIVEQFPDHKNISVIRHFKRFYPQRTVASHIVGYLGCMDMEQRGRMGLEQLFEDTLKGQPGEIIKTINSVGHYLAAQESKKALSGEHIQTALRLDYQLIAEEVFPEQEAGTMLVMDPQTGDIQVLVSRPTFDPNIFLQPLDMQAWRDLQEKKCFINRAFSACYPPASLFKLVTISAALEQGLITQETSWHCSGSITFADRVISCHKHEGHGRLTPRDALAQSCNIPFYDIGKRIKIDTLADFAHKLGLGTKTSVLLPEKPGLIPTSSWKRQTKGEPWWPGETLSAAIGQSFNLVTPLQIACMVGGICEGYLVRPRILTNEPITRKLVPLSPSTLDFLKRSMRRVIEAGSGRSLNKLAHMEIYAKTGTAQTSELSKRDLGKKFVEHGWFVAYVKYKQERPLALVILIENVGSSQVSAAVALKFLTQYTALIEGQTPRNLPEETQALSLIDQP